MTERWLPESEWDRVAERFVSRGVMLPHPAMAKIRVTEDDGQIVAMLVGQLVPHAEPLEIDPAYRGRIWWPSMLKAIEAEFPGIYVFAPNEHIARMAQSVNLVEQPWRVYHRPEGC